MAIESEAGWSESAQNHRPLEFRQFCYINSETIVREQTFEGKFGQSIFYARIE